MPIWDVDLVKYNFLCYFHDKIGFKIVEVDTFQGFGLRKTKWSQLLDSNGRKFREFLKIIYVCVCIKKFESEINFDKLWKIEV
jgi:hypothetical protein